MNYSQEQAIEALALMEARKDFWKFCLYIDYDFFNQRASLLEEIAHAFNDAYYQKQKPTYRINVSIFRRVGKSYITTLYICWLLGKRNDITIMRATYSREHSVIEHDKIRMFINNNKRYQRCFGKLNIEVENSTDIRMAGSNIINVRSVSVGAGTGIGASVVILDDGYKNYAEARSKSINDYTKRWYHSSWANSLEGDLRIEIVINTRWCEGELADELEQSGHFDKIIKKRALVDGYSVAEYIKSTEELREIQKYEPMLFNSMYQQEYSKAEAGLINQSLLRYVRYEDVPHGATFAMIDNKTTGKDYFAVGIYKVLTDEAQGATQIVLMDTIFTQQAISDELEYRIVNLINQYNCAYAFFEVNKDYSYYRNIKKQLKELGTVRCIPFNTHSNKEARIILNAKYIQKMIYIKTDDKEYNDFLNNIISYDLENKNEHDDAPDNVAMACEQVLLASYGKRLGVSDTWL